MSIHFVRMRPGALHLALACACLLLSSCDGIGESSEDRITAAMPIGPGLMEAEAKLLALAKDQKLGPAIEREFVAQLKVRALECAHGYEPPMMATESSIREALADKECFARADQKLGAWLSMRSVGLLLAAPPLRPLPTTAPALIPSREFISEASFAERAGVAILKPVASKVYQVVDLNDGKVIRNSDEDGYPGMSLSPNGRLFITRRGDKGEVRSTETDELLASYDEIEPWLFHWIGDVGAVFRRRAADHGEQSVFVDFNSGTETVLPFGAYEVERVLAMPGKPGHYVLLGNDRMGEMAIAESGGVRRASLLSETRLSSNGVWARNTSGLNADAKVYFGIFEHLQLIELDSLRTHQVPMLPMHLTEALATPDPDLLLLTGIFGHSTRGYESFLYSIANRTLAPVDRGSLPGTRLIYIPSLRKNAVIDQQKIVVIDSIPAGAPVPALAFLDQRAQEGDAYALANPGMFNRNGFQELGSAAPARESAAMTTARMLVKSERDGASSEFISAARRARNIDDATWAAAKAAIDADSGELSAAATAATAKPYGGPVAALGKNADVEAIGVYEAQTMMGRVGNVQVHVRHSSRPIILVLASYEKINWVITLEAGANLGAVLVSGYNQSQVLGGGDVRVYQIGQNYAYKHHSDEFSRLDAEVARWTGKQIDVFQGGYKGDTYFVGGGH